jgi:hypothetical protein
LVTPALPPEGETGARPERARGREARETRLPEPALPTVRVTIGRIEVRGASPALPAPGATPRPRPAVALDDYLKRTGRTRP